MPYICQLGRADYLTALNVIHKTTLQNRIYGCCADSLNFSYDTNLLDSLNSQRVDMAP